MHYDPQEKLLAQMSWSVS